MDYRHYLVFSIIVCLLAFFAVMKLRKDLPYQFDIIKQKDGVSIIGVDDWLSRKVDIKIYNRGEIIAESVIDPITHSCQITNVKIPEKGIISISRSDLFGKLIYRSKEIPLTTPEKDQSYIILVGASVGYHWNLPSFPERMGIDDVVIGNRVKFDFDKEDLIKTIIRYKHRPEMVILKECSAYFPRDINKSKVQYEQWIELLGQHNIVPILATTVPVTDDPQHMERQKSVDEWNAYVRELGLRKGFRVLDIARAVQVDKHDTHLRKEFAIEDGLHLNRVAYKEAMDPAMLSLLKNVK